MHDQIGQMLWEIPGGVWPSIAPLCTTPWDANTDGRAGAFDAGSLDFENDAVVTHRHAVGSERLFEFGVRATA